MKTHVMVDLETLGTATSSVIVAIGAVAFTSIGVHAEFYCNVSIDSGLAHGLSVDAGALKFWLTEASNQNRADLFKEPIRGLREALSDFTRFYQESEGTWLWSHGANFDEPVLRASYHAVYGRFVPWAFRNVRDTRTLFSLVPADTPRLPRAAEAKHNALSDAYYQAAQVRAAYLALGKELPSDE